MKRLLVLCICIGACCSTFSNLRADGKDRAVTGGDPAGGGGDVLGRCCFLGIVPEPILCEVTTQEACYFNTAPISWTPGLTCETPCGSHSDAYRGCGTLQPGPQGCPLFLSDDGQSFVLENSGPVNSARVWVSGTIVPQSNLCSPLTLPGLINNTIGPCFDGCGTLVQGVECVLFDADSGGRFRLQNYGNFGVGDRVQVQGRLLASCPSFCLEGEGCILENLIGPCNSEPTGACCSPLLANPTGCVVTTRVNCANIQGTYFGDGTRCTTNPCNTVMGRCCFLGIVPEPVLCEVTTWSNCIGRPAFVSWTPNADCSLGCDNTPRGACCVPFNVPGVAHCEYLTAAECESIGGDYHGDGTVCDPATPCPPLGRCCFVGIIFPPFLCDVTTEAECANYIGSFWAEGLICDNPCDGGVGSCCFDIDDGPLAYDTCVDGLSEQACISGGGVFDRGGVCTLVGCCLPNGGCQDADPECCVASGGEPAVNGERCLTAICIAHPTGACCFEGPLPNCIVMTAAACEEAGGSYRGDGTNCGVTGFCEPVGACCVPGNAIPEDHCEVATRFECLHLGGDYQGDGSVCPTSGFCDPGARGACCVPTAIPEGLCVETTAEECEAQGGEFFGLGTVCPPNGSLCFPHPVGACCIDVDDGPAQFDRCINVSAESCIAQGGFFQGVNTHCQVAACCFEGGYCQDLDPRCCLASGGRPASAGVLCGAIDCPVPATGACCFSSPLPNCTVMTRMDCIEAGGTYLGDGTNCGVTGFCDPLGACCLTPNVPGATNCIVTTAAHCEEIGGQFHGVNTQCNAIDVCPPLGRCCFVGIVADPILCDVTTEAACHNYAGFVSWTANLNCDMPCQPRDIFRGCGVLEPGPQSCVNFHADTGEVFALENSGPFFNGGHVWVRGEIDPHSILCFPVTVPALLNNTIGPCFEGCGLLVQGVECILFHSDNGSLYVLDNLGGHAVGDRVFVRGCLNANCVTFCQQGSGCIADNDIEPCENTPTGACCAGVLANVLGCIVTTPEICAAIDGEYQGDGSRCLPNNPCAPRLGRCCFLGFNPATPICQVMTRADCLSLPAPISWTPGLTCDVPCELPVRGACCVGLVTNATDCIVTTRVKCEEIGGHYLGDNTACGANACPVLGRCCFQGIVPFPVLCEVTTREACFQFAAPVSWTPGMTCDVPCHPDCDTPGDCNGDGVVDGNDVPCFVRAMLGGPAAGDRPQCAGMNASSEAAEVALFVELLMGP